MLSGRRLDLLDPQPGDIEIADIAHGLARVARWNGQTTGEHAFSVAQHSLLVVTIAAQAAPDAPRPFLLAALLHDAPEYVIGDLISPFKAVLGVDYKTFEHRLLAAVHRRFDLPDTLPAEWTAEIKRADNLAAWWEATRLAGFSFDEARLYFQEPAHVQKKGHPGAPPAEVASAWPTAEAQARYIRCFQELCRS